MWLFFYTYLKFTTLRLVYPRPKKKNSAKAAQKPPAYGSAKGCIKQIAVEYGEDKFYCNILCPGCKFFSSLLFSFVPFVLRLNICSLGNGSDDELDLKTPMTVPIYEDTETR